MQQLPIFEVDFQDISLETHGLKNSRSRVGDISTLQDSIEENGLIDPLVVWEAEENNYVLLAGYRRHAAIAKIQEQYPDAFAQLCVSIFTGSLEEALAKNLEENIQRQNLNPADEAEAVTRLYNKIDDQSRVALILGMSQPWVSQRVNLHRGLFPEGLEALRNGNINLTNARKLSRMLDEDGTPNVEMQTNFLDKLLKKSEDEVPDVKDRKRAKTYRTKKEVDELEMNVAKVNDDEQVVDEEHVTVIANVIRWFRCHIETDELIYGASEVYEEDEEEEGEEGEEFFSEEEETSKKRIRI